MNKDGWTTLMTTAVGGHLPVVDRLQEPGADPSATDKDGCVRKWVCVVGETKFHVPTLYSWAGSTCGQGCRRE